MKSVLISIKPKYCELIANGRKTIEVRKTKPKLQTPFKSYIYCTKASNKYQTICGGMVLNSDELYRHPKRGIEYGNSIELMLYDNCAKDNFLNGKVIGEFICERIIPISITYSDPDSRIALKEFPYTCLTDKQIIDYLGNGKTGYGWYISDLKIYDKPKKLSEFYTFCKEDAEIDNKKCGSCPYFLFDNDLINGYTRWCDVNKRKPIIHAPQSFQYVEELRE